MSDVMRPIPFEDFMNWLIDEFAKKRTIFSYPAEKFFFKHNDRRIKLFEHTLETPLGPAAGPHTQMAQNIVVAYLAGGRFFELKTVQKLDQLQIPRPCIEAQDEGYNVEWSQELQLEQSFDEYVKAWFALHLLQAVFNDQAAVSPAFIFNTSVGYDLKGIQSPKMDRFINHLIDASKSETFNAYKKQMLIWLKKQGIAEKLMALSPQGDRVVLERVVETLETISPQITNSVTVSTMHGCPPQEIEAICSYLLSEKKLHTYVKLNPTLLGFEDVQEILNNRGYRYIELDRSAFEHDLQYADALPMIRRLQQTAAEQGRVFGIKLSNTLGTKNKLGRLPGDEMYMSGRALFPLTINLASRLATDLDGKINISFSGGASIYNVRDILETGIFPVTMVTDLLKPGGYARLMQMVEAVDAHSWPEWTQAGQINLQKLNALAASALQDNYYSKERREVDSIKIKKALPVFDCYVSPCREACPIHQDVAEYIRLVEEERYLNAFKVIIETNPLPHITGYICDHQCMYHCTRWDYDDPVYIREMKKVAAEKSWETFIKNYGKTLAPKQTNGIKAAIVGAGPAGLSAAYFLARNGFEVTVFEKEEKAGGVVQNTIPDFRLPQYAIDRDVELVEKHGVNFQFEARNITVKNLKDQGFKYVFLAIGAGKSRKLPLNPECGPVIDALEFLHHFKQKKALQLGKKVAVIGGGNSAMDAARAAKRLTGVEQVYIVYRRTREFMPADREELEAALKDGVIFKELLLPVGFGKGRLTCQKMVLGQIDEDGRRSVKAIENAFEVLNVDAVITAIGEQVDEQFLKDNGIVLKKTQNEEVIVETNVQNVFIGADALRGPSTVVQSIADGKKAAELIALKEKQKPTAAADLKTLIDRSKLKADLLQRKGMVVALQTDPAHEAARCLSCNFVCDKCVEVCPNRANMALPVAVGGNDSFTDIAQILHIDGLCNECGNCETFCPYQGRPFDYAQGRPYKDKITVFWTKEDFEDSKNEGFWLRQRNGTLSFAARLKGQNGEIVLDQKGKLLKADWTQKDKYFDRFLAVLREVALNHPYLLKG